jgi:hypothetical protein
MPPRISTPITPKQSPKGKKSTVEFSHTIDLIYSEMETTLKQHIHVIQLEKPDIELVRLVFKDIEALISP